MAATGSLTAREIDSICLKYKHHLARWRRDPVAFCMEAFPDDRVKVPQWWQANVLWDLARHRYVSVAAGHGVGKSFLIGRAAWWLMITKKVPGEHLKVPCTGPSGNNIEDVLWHEIRSTHSELHPFLRDEFVVNSDTAFHVSRIETEEGEGSYGDAWFAKLRTASKEKPENMQGFHGKPTLFIVDEAAGVPDECYQVMGGALSGSESYGMMFANPGRLKGYFHRSHHSRDSMWKCHQISCLENTVNHRRKFFYFGAMGQRIPIVSNGRVSERYPKDMAQEYGENSPTYAFRVKGEFPNSEDETLILPQWVDDACKRGPEYSEESKKKSDRFMGVDIAYQGGDFSSLVIRCGNEIEHIERWFGHDPEESATRVAAVYEEYLVNKMKVKTIFVDDTGVGAGVTAILRKRGYPAVAVMVGVAAPDLPGTRCALVRDWLWWQCRIFFQRKRPRFAQTKGKAWERLIDSLPLITYESKTGGKVKVEAKKDLKKRLGVRSPDECDALNLTFFREAVDRMESDASSGELLRLQRAREAENSQRGRKKKPVRADAWRLA
jgi:hypothetical protein